MKKILLLLLLVPFFAFSQELPRHKKPKKTKDKEVYDVTKNNGTAVGYQTPEELRQQIEKDARLKMWSDAQKAEELAKMPKGGNLYISVVRNTIGAANMQWFEVVVMDNTGKEILREKLNESIASHFVVSGQAYWRNLDIVPLQERLPNMSRIYVIDEIGKNRHEYIVQY